MQSEMHFVFQSQNSIKTLKGCFPNILLIQFKRLFLFVILFDEFEIWACQSLFLFFCILHV